MYDIAMSSNTSGKESPNFDASYLGPVADVDYLTDVSKFDFDESDKGGFGTYLVKGGTFCLIAALIFTGYQFIPQGDSQVNRYEVQSLHDWEKKSDQVVLNNNYLVSVERRFAANKTLDMTTTGSTRISNLIEKSQEQMIDSKMKPFKSSKAEIGNKELKGKMYIVQAGDTLSKIAQMFKTSSKTIIAMNEIENPSLIRPGMRLVVTE